VVLGVDLQEVWLAEVRSAEGGSLVDREGNLIDLSSVIAEGEEVRSADVVSVLFVLNTKTLTELELALEGDALGSVEEEALDRGLGWSGCGVLDVARAFKLEVLCELDLVLVLGSKV
jgi:hypothetical protein